MRVCILGAGGLGSVLGGYLAETGVEVTLVGRAAHVDAIKQKGLRISGVRGEHLITENLECVTHPKVTSGPFDYFILSVKGKDTDAALASADPLRDRIGAALSVQNTANRNQKLADWIGRDRVIGAAVIEGGELVAPGHARNHVTTPITAYFGELEDRGAGERAKALASAFRAADLPAKAVDNIEQVIWEKLTQICLASGWSVSTLVGNPKLSFPDGLLVREGAEHYVQLAKELLAFYHAVGYSPQNFFAPLSHLRELDDLPFGEAVDMALGVGEGFRKRGARDVRTSMHKDVLEGRRTEVDDILKPVIEMAREKGVAMPTVEAAYRIIKTLDSAARE